MNAPWIHHFLQTDLERVDAYLLGICGKHTAHTDHQKLFNHPFEYTFWCGRISEVHKNFAILPP
jgi:hypothetical protein